MLQFILHNTYLRQPLLRVFVYVDLVSDMLGSEKYKLSWQTALDSFQNPHINRYL